MELTNKTCSRCYRLLSAELFYKRGDKPHLLASWCKGCISEVNKEEWSRTGHLESRRDIQRNKELKREYGITLDDYRDMFSRQGERCAICRRQDSGRKQNRNMCVDHDHATGLVRGLLCNRCNHAIGLLGDIAENCSAAATYLTQTKGALIDADKTASST